MILEGGDALVHHIVFVSFVDLFLEFADQDGLLALFSLREILVQRRDFLAVLETAVLEVGVVVVPDPYSVDVRVVVNHHYEVGCDMHVEFTSP